MLKPHEKFLEFNNTNVYFIAADGTWYIAIKPICKALSVNFSRQLRTLKADPILGAAWSIQTIQVGSDQRRKFACLPEFYVYGWLFSIKSDSEALADYKWKCYELLYKHFHGSITKRNELLGAKVSTELAIINKHNILMNNDDYKALLNLKKMSKASKKQLARLDTETALQLPLWN